MEQAARQRIDKWLWFARVVKSRSLATRLVTDGYVRLNGQRVSSAAKPVGIGDVLTIALLSDVRVLRVAAIGLRRGPFREACQLYTDIGQSPMSPGATNAAALAMPLAKD